MTDKKSNNFKRMVRKLCYSKQANERHGEWAVFLDKAIEIKQKEKSNFAPHIAKIICKKTSGKLTMSLTLKWQKK